MDKILSDSKILEHLEKIGISPGEIEGQLSNLRNGFPHAKLIDPCTINKGVLSLSDDQRLKAIKIYESAIDLIDVCKFVPASGAATRMFKDLINEYSIMKESDGKLSDYISTQKLVKNLSKFAFKRDLESKIESYETEFKKLLEVLLFENGLNYSNLPKGLIKFHDYESSSKTAFEEQLAESKKYINSSNSCKIHFTVPKNSLNAIKAHIDEVIQKDEESDVAFEITYSIQDPSTDTVAIDSDGKPLLSSDGELIFRPAGHGALLKNINEIDADIIFIKNIDNVSAEKYIDEIAGYKKMLAGYLIEIRDGVFNSLRKLDSSNIDEDEVLKIAEFCKDKLFIDFASFEELDMSSKIKYLHKKLNRPIRVCGVVKNEGEPGGGPFWLENNEGEMSLQIVESSQVDMESDSQKEIWESSTHFNSVDLVCSVRNYEGKKFDLAKYVDESAGIVTTKSYIGNTIKALELPGLWNGTMADWNTLFIEVPLITFTPVKTVFDLLREEHQTN